jgi:hypothetical protein
MGCKAQSAKRYEIGVITEVICQQCCIPRGAKGVHETKIRNFSEGSTRVRIDVACASVGPLAYSGLTTWSQDILIAGANRVSRYNEEVLREEIAHNLTTRAPGGIQQVTVDAMFYVDQVDAQALDTMPLTLSVLNPT